MRIRILQRPTERSIDGIQLERFEPGRQYEVGNALGALFLAEGWAEPVPLDEPALVVPLIDVDSFLSKARADKGTPANLVKDKNPPYWDRLPQAVAADCDRRQRQQPARVSERRRKK